MTTTGSRDRRRSQDRAETIAGGRTYLGIEFGSTRIKAALVDERGTPLAAGSHPWENQHVDGNWTYSVENIWEGLRACYADLAANVHDRWGTEFTEPAGLGVSAMMHGYLAFDAQGELLVPFRTWRNTYTTRAAAMLTKAFGQNIPLRWSVSHLLHAVLGGEQHVTRIAHLTTLAGYVHWRLSGRQVLGVGDASGMVPINSTTGSYDERMLEAFAGLDAISSMPWSLQELLPEVLVAGEDAGALTEEGARLLDPTATLRSGVPMAPPEGDAGTGMVATNSVVPRTGNISAGTSAFAMVVLEDDLKGVREEVDLVATPAGDPAAMIHTNNCTGDLDAWMGVFEELAALLGAQIDVTELYRRLFGIALEGRADGGGLVSYNYLSGEHQTGVPSGRPLFVRTQGAELNLANFMRTQLYAAFGALAVGMKILLEEEDVAVDLLYGHGGIFRTEGVAQQVLADALNAPIAVGDSAGEGGAWGMALLAAYAAHRRTAGQEAKELADFLAEDVFVDIALSAVKPDPEGSLGHQKWLADYRAGLEVERLAGSVLR